MTLLVKSRAGYRNLCRLLTLGHARCEKPQSRVTWDELRAHADGLVALVREPRLAEPVREIFGADAYGELWRHRDPDEERANRRLLATGIAPLATGDVRHAQPAGKRLLDAFTCIAHSARLDDAGRLLLPNAERHVHTPAAVAKRFADLPAGALEHARGRGALRVPARGPGLRVPGLPARRGRDAAGKAARARLRRRARALRREACPRRRARSSSTSSA